MKLPNFRRLFKNDYPKEFQDLIDQLSVSINVGIETLYDALNKRLSFKDNFAGTFKEITVSVDASGKPKSQVLFKMDIDGKVDGLITLYVANVTNPKSYVAGGIYISWTQTQNGVLIENIKGLYPNDEYIIRFVAFVQ